MNNQIKIYENQKIRSAWDTEKEEWYFSIVDVITVLTESNNPSAYWRKLKQRLKEEGNETVTNCHALKMKALDGKMRNTDVANIEQLLRIIQSIPSKKAEPFKMWLAEVGKERMEEIVDPEKAVRRAYETYQKKGYDADWINQRILSIRVRNELTEEWKNNGVEEGKEYAILTNEITKGWSGMTVKEYKSLKGLTNENLRDNMSTMEMVLNMLAEATTTELSKVHKPKNFEENQEIAKRGGSYAGQVRENIEKDTERPVITSKNASELNLLVTKTIEEIASIDDDKND